MRSWKKKKKSKGFQYPEARREGSSKLENNHASNVKRKLFIEGGMRIIILQPMKSNNKSLISRLKIFGKPTGPFKFHSECENFASLAA